MFRFKTMAPTPILEKRVNTAQGALGSSTSTIAYVGFGIAACVGLAIAIILTVVWYRKRARRAREDERGAAFLTVKGVIKEDSTSEPLPAYVLTKLKQIVTVIIESLLALLQ